jgi:hypothetical protein
VSKIDDAYHEAAHVVVGAALGLRLKQATITRPHDSLGHVEFYGSHKSREAWLIMYAAGVAWERRYGKLVYAQSDLECIRAMRVTGTARVLTLERAAWAILDTRGHLQGRIALALFEGDLTHAAVKALFQPKT